MKLGRAFAATAFVSLVISACGGGGGSTEAPNEGLDGNNDAAVTSLGIWTWVGGSQSTSQVPPVYGTQGIASGTNTPGTRNSRNSAYWVDSSGNLWLYGGNNDGPGAAGGNYDAAMWKYTVTSNEWTWVSGSDGTGIYPTYGTQGTPSAGNTPGSRLGPVYWKDTSGNFWLFGGYGFGISADVQGYTSDVWKYSPTSNEWTWMSGSDTPSASANYGTQGVGSTNNTPGGRIPLAFWADQSGNLWAYGFNGADLWEYNIGNAEWTWVAGPSSSPNQNGVYGTQGVASFSNYPSYRTDASFWTDAHGNFWLFGGVFNDAGVPYEYDDLWRFSPTDGWAWMSGSDTANVESSYGTMGTMSASVGPGPRYNANVTVDLNGDFLLFGGTGCDIGYSPACPGTSVLRDLWKYSYNANEWTWIGGPDTDSVTGSAGTYGSQGVGSSSNIPAGQDASITWTDSSGRFWLFSTALWTFQEQ